MIVMAFISFFIISIFSFFGFSLRINTLNRIVVNTPMEIFELSIPLANETINTLHFDKTTLEKNLRSFYDAKVLDVVESYTLDFYYYNSADESICTSNKCQAVELTFESDISSFYHYQRKMFYEIKRKS